jgi:hypothetical protein
MHSEARADHRGRRAATSPRQARWRELGRARRASNGGATAVRLALRRPELVRSLVLIEPVIMSLLLEAGDALFGEYRDMAEGFVVRKRPHRIGGLRSCCVRLS